MAYRPTGYRCQVMLFLDKFCIAQHSEELLGFAFPLPEAYGPIQPLFLNEWS